MPVIIVYAAVIAHQQVILNDYITVKSYPISANDYLYVLDLLKRNHDTNTITIINIIPLANKQEGLNE